MQCELLLGCPFVPHTGSMPLYAAMEFYAAQMRVILPSISAPFGLPQPNVTVRAKKILLPPTVRRPLLPGLE
jgi:hypothetical protein